MISGLLFLFPCQQRWVPLNSVMYSCVDYDYDTRFPFSWFCCSISLVCCRFLKKRSPTKQGRGVPTNLWAWRTESELRKHEKFSQRATANGAQGRRKHVRREKFSQKTTSKSPPSSAISIFCRKNCQTFCCRFCKFSKFREIS